MNPVFLIDAARLCAVIAALYELMVSTRMLVTNEPRWVSGRVFSIFGIGMSVFCIIVGLSVFKQMGSDFMVYDSVRAVAVGVGWTVCFATFVARTLMRIPNPGFAVAAYVLTVAGSLVTSYADHFAKFS